MKSNIVDRIGFGAWQIGGSNIVDGKNIGWNDLDHEHSNRLVSMAYDAGIRFFDTSCGYGRGLSEKISRFFSNGFWQTKLCLYSIKESKCFVKGFLFLFVPAISIP